MIITIIVLLILAGVALATLTGQGNIIGNAENAVGKYNNSVIKEQELLNEIEKYLINNGYGENEEIEDSKVDENGLAKEDTIIKPDENSNIQIVIPAGFAPVILETGTTQSLPGENGSVKKIMPYEEWNNITIEDINKGIVAVDHAITYDNGQASGTVPDFNEFVWVPIPDSNKFARTAWIISDGEDTYGEQKISDQLMENCFWEDKTTTEYTNMISSVQEHKGFYIGRYEATQGSGNIAQSKRQIELPWSMITREETITACSKLDSNENMHLMYGIEWDSVLNWLIGNAVISSSTSGETKIMDLDDIEKSSYTWGNYENSIGDAALGSSYGYVVGSGYSEYWKANNIYDLAGNASECTQEKYSTDSQIVVRGRVLDYNGGDGPSATRGTFTEDSYGSRDDERFSR